MDHRPLHTLRRCVAQDPGKYPPLAFSHLDQFLAMAFAQLTFRESLRDIETCLRAQSTKLYHLGIRGRIARSPLADANEKRPWPISRDRALRLIAVARRLYADEPVGVELAHTAYALDTTTIDVSWALFPWARVGVTTGAVKLHPLLDLRGNMPTFIHISDGTLHEGHVLDQIAFEPGRFYVMDRGFLDFARRYAMQQTHAVLVTRARSNLQYRRVYSHPVDQATGLRGDQPIGLTGVHSGTDDPAHVRRIKSSDAEHKKLLVVLTHVFELPALTVPQRYRCRWQVEVFFKWITPHVRLKACFGTSENAVNTQVWIAIAVDVFVAIVKKRLHRDASLYPILQTLSLTLFEKTPLDQLLANVACEMDPTPNGH